MPCATGYGYGRSRGRCVTSLERLQGQAAAILVAQTAGRTAFADCCTGRLPPGYIYPPVGAPLGGAATRAASFLDLRSLLYGLG